MTTNTSSQSNSIILGIDEVGRGPWAGPLVVGAVILKQQTAAASDRSDSRAKEPEFWQKLTDSKKLTAKRRQELDPIITQEAIATGLGWVSSQELDRYGMSASLKLATRRAVKQILATKAYFNEIIIDGTVNFLQNTPLADRVTTLPKADLLIREVSAASIIAKVARDQYMTDLAGQYPGYGFEKHMGYGTAAHREALEALGVTPEHRQSFRPIRGIIENSQKSPQTHKNVKKSSKNSRSLAKNKRNLPQNPLERPLDNLKDMTNFRALSDSGKGQKAELAVADYLIAQNHQIIAHNFKTKTYEIDLISVKNHQIFFTEVKYSENPTTEGSPLVRIDQRKRQKIQRSAESFLANHPCYQPYQPLLAVAAVTGKDFSQIEWFELTK